MLRNEFRHYISSVSSYRPLTVGLDLCYSLEIADSTVGPIDVQDLSHPILREADVGSALGLEISCKVGNAQVGADRLCCFSFISYVLKQLREMNHAVSDIFRDAATSDVDNSLILMYHMIFDHGPAQRSKPLICLQKITLELAVSEAVQDLVSGIKAVDVYDILGTNPPLPLQMCFDDLTSKLFGHLAGCFPALFGAHSTALQKNAHFLSSSLDSILRTISASTDETRKAKAELAYQLFVGDARSRQGILPDEAGTRTLNKSDDDSGSAIKSNAMVATERDRNELVRSIARRMYCLRMKLLPQATQQGLPAVVPKTEEVIGIHDSMPELAMEDHTFIESYEFCDDLAANDRDVDILSSQPSSPASILEIDSPPTSPFLDPSQEDADGGLCGSISPILGGTDSQDEILGFF